MKTLTRIDCENSVLEFSAIINGQNKKGDLLYVGIDGDPKGGEYSKFFPDFNVKTFDICPEFSPDIVGDITKTEFQDSSWDIVICVQTLEHIKDLFKLSGELHRIIRPNGRAIVDCPWGYPYHGQKLFGDYWRISKDGMVALFEDNFIIEKINFSNDNTSCLLKSKKI